MIEIDDKFTKFSDELKDDIKKTVIITRCMATMLKCMLNTLIYF